MASKIHILADAVANRIAAGEVVQRPAAVAKELLENALDAGSTAITLSIEDGGKARLQVIDNGEGMDEVDARLCFERHATSKLKDTDDFATLCTFGFRGEALAAIGSVAHVDLVTRRADQEVGTQVRLEGGERKYQGLVQTAVGTQVQVKNLFFNVPARRSFLKRAAVEQRHVVDIFQQLALSRPDVGFRYYQGERQVYRLAPQPLSHRIVQLFGQSYREQLIPCQESTQLLHIKGYVGTPQQAKKTRGGQFFFVNERYVKNGLLHHAVKTAFEGLIPPSSHPFYLLFLTMPPHQVDVNVHPTKIEVKFEEERAVYAILIAAVRKALATHHMTPSLDFEYDPQNPFSVGRKPTERLRQEERKYMQFKEHNPTTQANKEQDHIPPAMPGVHLPTTIAPRKTPISPQPPAAPPKPTEGEESQEIVQTLPLEEPTSQPISQPKKMQLHRRYILAQVKSGLLLVDQRAAHMRILYERFLQQLKDTQGSSQQLLIPCQVTLLPNTIALLHEHLAALQALGFHLKVSHAKPLEVAVLGLPPEVTSLPVEETLQGLLATYQQEIMPQQLPIHQGWARAMAQRAALSPRRALDTQEMTALIDQLFACAHPNHDLDGHPIWRVLTEEDLAELLHTP